MHIHSSSVSDYPYLINMFVPINTIRKTPDGGWILLSHEDNSIDRALTPNVEHSLINQVK